MHMDLIIKRENSKISFHYYLSRMLKIVIHVFFINHNALLYNLLYEDNCFIIQEKATNQCYILQQYILYLTFEKYLNITDKTWFKNNPRIDLQTPNSLEHKTYHILITKIYKDTNCIKIIIHKFKEMNTNVLTH